MRRCAIQYLNASAVVILSLAVSACEQTVDIDFPREDPSIVISSFFWPDARFELCLTEARDLVDGDDAIRWIEQATVELWEDGRRLEVVPYVGECLYRSDTRRPVPGSEYTLKVVSDGYPDVQATDESPMPIPTTFEYEIDQIGQDAGSVDVTIQLQDRPDMDNWFRLMVFYRHTEEDGTVWYGVPGFSTDDDGILLENQDAVDLEDDIRFETAFFSDDRFSTGADGHQIRLEIPPPVLEFGTPDIDLVVVVDVISEHFYHYAVTERLQRLVGDNPFAEPVRVATNVENGFGIFGGFNRSALDVSIR